MVDMNTTHTESKAFGNPPTDARRFIIAQREWWCSSSGSSLVTVRVFDTVTGRQGIGRGWCMTGVASACQLAAEALGFAYSDPEKPSPMTALVDSVNVTRKGDLHNPHAWVARQD